MEDNNEKVQSNENKNQEVIKEKSNGLALAGLICSLCGLITCGITSFIGLILSIVGLSKSKSMDGKGKGLAIGGIISGILIMILQIVVLVLIVLGISNTVSGATNSFMRTFNTDKIIEMIEEQVQKMDDLEKEYTIDCEPETDCN